MKIFPGFVKLDTKPYLNSIEFKQKLYPFGAVRQSNHAKFASVGFNLSFIPLSILNSYPVRSYISFWALKFLGLL